MLYYITILNIRVLFLVQKKKKLGAFVNLFFSCARIRIWSRNLGPHVSRMPLNLEHLFSQQPMRFCHICLLSSENIACFHCKNLTWKFLCRYKIVNKYVSPLQDNRDLLRPWALDTISAPPM